MMNIIREAMTKLDECRKDGKWNLTDLDCWLQKYPDLIRTSLDELENVIHLDLSDQQQVIA